MEANVCYMLMFLQCVCPDNNNRLTLLSCRAGVDRGERANANANSFQYGFCGSALMGRLNSEPNLKNEVTDITVIVVNSVYFMFIPTEHGIKHSSN